MSDWKNVQYKDGKYRTGEGGGGGGSSTLAGLDDVTISSAGDGQVLKYDNTTSKWVNANESSSSTHDYTTTEKVIGTLLGKPLYEKTVVYPKSDFSAVRQILNHNISNLKYMYKMEGVMVANNQQPLTTGYDWGSAYGCGIGDISDTTFQINIGTSRYSSLVECIVTMQYTKTTD